MLAATGLQQAGNGFVNYSRQDRGGQSLNQQRFCSKRTILAAVTNGDSSAEAILKDAGKEMCLEGFYDEQQHVVYPILYMRVE